MVSSSALMASSYGSEVSWARVTFSRVWASWAAGVSGWVVVMVVPPDRDWADATILPSLQRFLVELPPVECLGDALVVREFQVVAEIPIPFGTDGVSPHARLTALDPALAAIDP